MAVDSFLVPPVERNLMQLKVRRVGPREEREQNKNQQQGPASDRKPMKKSTEAVPENCVTGSKVDCKV